MKSKIGISLGVLGALPFICSLFGGYTPLLLIAGYIFIREEDEWLRKMTVKAVILTVVFSLLYYVLGIIPEMLYIINDLVGIFGGYFYPSKIHSFFDFLQSGVSFVKEIVMIFMAIMALLKKDIKVKAVDDLVD